MNPIISECIVYRARQHTNSSHQDRSEHIADSVHQPLIAALNALEPTDCWTCDDAEYLLHNGYAKMQWINNPESISVKLLNTLIETSHIDLALELLPHCSTAATLTPLIAHLAKRERWHQIIQLAESQPHEISACLLRTPFPLTTTSIAALWRLELLAEVLKPWTSHHAPATPAIFRLYRWDALAAQPASLQLHSFVCCLDAEPDLDLGSIATPRNQTLIELLTAKHLVPILEHYVLRQQSCATISKVFTSCLNRNQEAAIVLKSLGAQYERPTFDMHDLLAAIKMRDASLVDCILSLPSPHASSNERSNLISKGAYEALKTAISLGCCTIFGALLNAGLESSLLRNQGTKVINTILEAHHLAWDVRSTLLELALQARFLTLSPMRDEPTLESIVNLMSHLPLERALDVWRLFIDKLHPSSDNLGGIYRYLLACLLPLIMTTDEWAQFVNILPPEARDDRAKARAMVVLAHMVSQRTLRDPQIISRLANLFVYLLPEDDHLYIALFCPARGPSVWAALCYNRNNALIQELAEAGFPLKWRGATALDCAIQQRAWHIAHNLMRDIDAIETEQLLGVANALAAALDAAQQEGRYSRSCPLAGADECADLIITRADDIVGVYDLVPRILAVWTIMSHAKKHETCLPLFSHVDAFRCNHRGESLAATMLLQADSLNLADAIRSWLNSRPDAWEITCPDKGLSFMQQIIQTARLQPDNAANTGWLLLITQIWANAVPAHNLDITLSEAVLGREPIALAWAVSPEWGALLQRLKDGHAPSSTECIL